MWTIYIQHLVPTFYPGCVYDLLIFRHFKIFSHFLNRCDLPLRQYLNLSRVTTSNIRDFHIWIEGASLPTHLTIIAFRASIRRNWTVSLWALWRSGISPSRHMSGLSGAVCPVTKLISLHTACQNTLMSLHFQRQWYLVPLAELHLGQFGETPGVYLLYI